MARIRTIKPDFMDSGSTKGLTREARLFFLQMLTECDDEGRMKFTPRRLAGLLYPGDEDVNAAAITKWTAECELMGMVERYEVSGEVFLHMPNFNKHQVISKPKNSKVPPCPNCEVGTGQGQDSPGSATGRKGKWNREVEREVEQEPSGDFSSQVFQELSQRRLKARLANAPGITDPGKWLKRVATEERKRLGERLAELLESHPNSSVSRMADYLDGMTPPAQFAQPDDTPHVGAGGAMHLRALKEQLR